MKSFITTASPPYRIIIWTAMISMSWLACRVQKIPATTDQEHSLVIQGPLWGAMWQQKAAEYKALCYQAFNIARLRLDAILLQPHNLPLAIVTDIDETVLDNSPYTVHQVLHESGYAENSWIEWTARSECDTIPGGLSFLKYASSKDVQVFYITNRVAEEKEPTLKNLQRWNFPNADQEHLFLRQTISGKEPRRGIVAQKHEIVMLLGDNLSDFSAAFDKQPFEKRDAAVTNNASLFGNRFIVLPNVAYGDWEGALYNFNYKLTPAQKDSIIQLQLKTY
ncbi:MAG: 5'-nucleotidase, lipoprotein e(P4) family [Ferruginibacter sp.]